jgi:hypothetical protein
MALVGFLTNGLDRPGTATAGWLQAALAVALFVSSGSTCRPTTTWRLNVTAWATDCGRRSLFFDGPADVLSPLDRTGRACDDPPS